MKRLRIKTYDTHRNSCDLELFTNSKQRTVFPFINGMYTGDSSSVWTLASIIRYYSYCNS